MPVVELQRRPLVAQGGGTFRVYSNEGAWFIGDALDLNGTEENDTTTVTLQVDPTPIAALIAGTGTYTLRAHLELTIGAGIGPEDLTFLVGTELYSYSGTGNPSMDDSDFPPNVTVDSAVVEVTSGSYTVDLEGDAVITEDTWVGVLFMEAELGEVSVTVGTGSYLEIVEP
jgi:hypothetical protein